MSNKNNDYYKTLQVHPEAGQEIIDAAYRCLSKQYHPDINKNPMATEYMKDINIAYSIVGDFKKRKQYNYELFKENKSAKPGTSPFSNASPFSGSSAFSNIPKQEKKDTSRDLKNEEAAANKILDDFFSDTVNETWETAYSKLTSLDMKNIPLSDFIEWKKLVTQIYKLGGYKISFFRRYLNCEYAGVIYPVILQFSVSLNEMHVMTGQISEESTQKYVAFDGHNWRVCLGYKDLKPNILKFKYLAQALPKLGREDVFVKAIEKIDLLTGVFSLNGFLEQADREWLRYKRYGNPLSIAIITIEPILEKQAQADGTSQDAYISYFAESLCSNMRRTDIIGRCGEFSFVILFTETKLADSKKALNKLLDSCEADDYLNYKVYSACTALNKGDIAKAIKETQEKVKIREERNEGTFAGDDSQADDKTQLGKYKVSDILGFNKKGRNHF